MRSSNQHSFAQVPRANIPRSVFQRDFKHKSTFQTGKLIPFYVDEGLPGDTIKVKANIFARIGTPVVPWMDNLHIRTWFFQVPNRLLWEHWKEFMGEQPEPDPDFSETYRIPIVDSGAGWQHGDMPSYMGIPMRIANLETNCLPTRAYNKIVNDWFRDQNLQDTMPLNISDNDDDDADAADLWTLAKKHDYFTSCLPWPQKGPDVLLPLGDSAPVFGNGKTLGFTDGTDNFGMVAIDNSNDTGAAGSAYDQNVGTTGVGGDTVTNNRRMGVVETGESGLYADL